MYSVFMHAKLDLKVCFEVRTDFHNCSNSKIVAHFQSGPKWPRNNQLAYSSEVKPETHGKSQSLAQSLAYICRYVEDLYII